MTFLTSILFSISCNFDTIYIANHLRKNNITTYKYNIITISIITTLSIFISMILGNILSLFILQKYSNTVGGVCLSFFGLYYMLKHIKLLEQTNNFDTSYYLNNFDKCENIISNETLSLKNSNNLNFSKTLSISYVLSYDNLILGIASGITNMNIPLITFINFILTMLLMLLFKYNILKSNSIIIKYKDIINALILFFLGIIEMFI